MHENSVPFKVFMKCHDQYIIGAKGPIAVKHEPVFRWMEFFKVPHEYQERCFDLVNAASGNIIKMLRTEEK